MSARKSFNPQLGNGGDRIMRLTIVGVDDILAQLWSHYDTPWEAGAAGENQYWNPSSLTLMIFDCDYSNLLVDQLEPGLCDSLIGMGLILNCCYPYPIFLEVGCCKHG